MVSRTARNFPVVTTENIKMMIVLDEAHSIAVALSKSVNMRVTAAERYAALCRHVHSPDTDGAMQMIKAGYEPTDIGVWEMLTEDPAYPQQLGRSESARKKLKFIGSQADPEAADRADRDYHTNYARSSCYNTDLNQNSNVTDQSRPDANQEHREMGVLSDERLEHIGEELRVISVNHQLEELVAEFNALRRADQDEFLRRVGAARVT
jgi:hypothetical protein